MPLVREKFKVELDDGTGTWPYNITAYVDLKIGIEIDRGRADEFGQIEASTMTLTLKNNDGRFTLGKASPPYPLIVDMPIRAWVQKSGGTWSRRFTGYVNTWPVEWPGGKKVSKVAISASDRLARLARRPLTGVAMTNEIALDEPFAHWPLNDPSGSTTAANKAAATSPMASFGTGSAVTFGNTTPPGADASPAATLAGGKYLAATTEAQPIAAILVAFKVTALPAAARFVTTNLSARVAGGEEFMVTMASSGQVGGVDRSGTSIFTAGSLADGQPHVAEYIIDPSGTDSFYVDGVLIGTDPAAGSRATPWVALGLGIDFIDALAHVALFSTVPSGARITAHAAAILTQFAGERSDQRVARLAAYANIPTGDLALEVGAQTMGPLTGIDGVPVMDTLRLVESAEQGLLFINASGQLVMQNRSHRYNRAAAVTIPASKIDVSARFSADNQGLINQCSVTRDGGAAQIVTDPASIATFELYPDERTLALQNDDEAVQIAHWVVANHSQPAPRLSSAKVDLLTNSSTISDAMLDLEISDAITITTLPSQAAASSVTLFVEGWKERIALEEWSMDLNTSPYSVGGGQVFQLDVTPLDSVYRLAL